VYPHCTNGSRIKHLAFAEQNKTEHPALQNLKFLTFFFFYGSFWPSWPQIRPTDINADPWPTALHKNCQHYLISTTAEKKIARNYNSEKIKYCRPLSFKFSGKKEEPRKCGCTASA
jgi:hypothetical protein